MTSTTDAHHTVQGQRVAVPMTVDHAVAALSVHTADADTIDDTLPDDLEAVRLPGGRGLALLLCVRYVENPLGAYDEVVVGTAAQPVGATPLRTAADLLRGRAGVWVDRMAVDQPFTREAGEAIWGYPKTLDEIEMGREGRSWTTTWARDGRSIAHVRMPAGGALPAPPLRLRTYTRLGDATVATSLTARASGVGGRPGGVELTLGTHPEADHLRRLGLEGRAVATAWLSRASMRFSTATPLAAA